MRLLGILIVGVIAMCIPLTALPQKLEYSIDYDALFALHAERIIEAEDGNSASLEMPGEVILRRLGPLGSHRYSGTDMSAEGAIGCVMILLSEMKAFEAMCPESATEDQKAYLENAFDRVAAFYAANTYPSVSFDTFNTHHRLRISLLADKQKMADPQICDGNQDFLMMFAMILSEYLPEALDRQLATPRLPVISPCL